MTILTYIIASLLKKYRFKRETENLKNLLKAARFAY